MIGAAPQNKGMTLTSGEHIERSQLIPGIDGHRAVESGRRT
jgi:hypothetical protein